MLRNEEMFYLAKQAVINYFNENLDPTDIFKLTHDDVFVVWFCKTLQHFKILLSTTVHDGMYYEVTYNGDVSEMYLDAYKKWQHKEMNVLSNNAPKIEQLPEEEPAEALIEEVVEESVVDGGEEDNSFQEEPEETTNEEPEEREESEQEEEV